MLLAMSNIQNYMDSLQGFTVKRCNCGAVSLEHEQANDSISMAEETARELGFEVPVDAAYCHCNHCVNHWGLDLCACGSGESPEKCTGNYACCGSPAQEQSKSILQALAATM